MARPSQQITLEVIGKPAPENLGGFAAVIADMLERAAPKLVKPVDDEESEPLNCNNKRG